MIGTLDGPAPVGVEMIQVKEKRWQAFIFLPLLLFFFFFFPFMLLFRYFTVISLLVLPIHTYDGLSTPPMGWYVSSTFEFLLIDNDRVSPAYAVM